ncbi:preprotein translocase subunit SecG [Magnetospirillum sp. ME-1]|uniref:preprotein translocase subunit SecG n=1 Tax=Magnetospirillum sp. ME-1 TaxID=1639348 RepID=UPI000A17EA00|nr:preprotein translocase subunit SecG [Magnetospirillum sp. ME-1]ARJ65802.1 preprotein translocase subunit SecG [Magnetospirillum sp. ME-1]
MDVFPIILVIHLILAIALVGVILLQRSEGGALGIGGGSGGGLMTGRAAGNLLTRTTAILATSFFVTSLVLALLANSRTGGSSPFEKLNDVPAAAAPAAPAEPAAPSAPLAR